MASRACNVNMKKSKLPEAAIFALKPAAFDGL